MYEELFHSPDRPFRATPDSKFYFPHESIESARQTIVRAVLRAEGPVMVLGGAGLGKSLLGMVVAEDLASRFDIVKLHAAGVCSRRALLQSILFELQLPYRELTEGDLRLSILNRLEPSQEHAPDGVLIIVDEAHTLSAKLLEELRLITNFTRGNQPRARLVLIGNLRLEHTFAEPQMESFNQRLAARCYLQPMNRQQTRDFVQHQLTVAGVDPRQMITDDALATIYAASEGVPRLSNQIMDHALVLAITRGQCPLSSALVEEAWADLQQLPAPWHTGAERIATANSSIPTNLSSIEFGTLDGDGDGDLDQPVNIQPVTIEYHSQIGGGLDSELRLVDESIDEFTEKRKNNFFAAFSPAEVELEDEDQELSFADGLGISELECDAGVPGDSLLGNPTDNGETARSAVSFESETCAELTRPSVVFDLQLARERARQYEFIECSDELQLAPEPTIDSFFANRPTDERLLALEAEQYELDSMGVWENDPPLSSDDDRSPQFKLASVIPMPTSLDLFGSDFDDEVCLTSQEESVASGSKNVAGRQLDEEETAEFTNVQLPPTAQQAVEAADYVARIQEFADSIANANRQFADPPIPTVDQILADNRSAASQLATFESAIDTWSVDVNGLDIENEIAVHDEIEDLVSQLNFAAFSVEPFSIEQIEVGPRDQRSRPPEDAIRSGAQAEIYTLHRPQELSEESVFSGWSGDTRNNFDDDRDLLVVEEDLPLTAQSTNERELPVTKIAPYSQLFAKLRK